MAFVLARMQALLSGALPRRDDDRGASLVEYALLLALIAVICVVAVTILGEEASTAFDSTGEGFATT
jgi:Flp pilus assembly pilin Flp